MTRRRLLAGLLTLIMVLQALVPGAALAKSSKPSNDNLITIGKLTKKDYPQIDKDTALRVAREQKNKRKGLMGTRGATLFSTGSPYINGQQPADPDKPKYWANVMGELKTTGIDGTAFDWDRVLGKGAKVKLLFTQTNGNVMTGVRFYLEVDSAGQYYWKNSDGKPTYLPLYDADGNPYTYNVQIERNFSEDVQLIIQESNGTPKAAWRPEGDKQVATISFLDIEIRQLASTKFVSEWHTSVAEANRPQIEGYFKVEEDLDNNFNFPKNDTTRTILRSSFVENFEEDEDNGPWSFLPDELKKTPETVEVKTNTAGLTFAEAGGVKTVKSGDHKYKYEFAYNVIDGGKLTMTEIIPVTFDANGGKFASITDPAAKQEIKKEVEYEKDVTAPEEPTKDRETFKGWGIKAPGSGTLTPVKDADYQSIKAAKTFYAIWESKAFTADGLTVHESYKEGNTYVNDFIPKLDELKVKVQVEGNGLTNEDKLAILDDSNNPLTEKAAVKEYLYTKLGEENDNKIDRTVEIKGRVTDAAGKTHDVMIPIKVIKNIYEAKTKEGRPVYVPDGYVKVTVDPTNKAKDPQKYTYYVNPKANVVIPGENPTGTGNNQFTKWLIKGTETEYKLADHPRHKFTEAETTIEAQYVSDVIPQTGDKKPDTVPKNFVEVKFVPTEKATDTAEKIYWVNPEKEVTIPVANPVGKQYFTFKEWKIGEKADGAVYNPAVAQKFETATTITATYDKAEDIIPYDPSVPDPMVRPDGYVRVTFAADPGLKLTEQKAYYVKNNAKITLKAIKGDTTNYGYPGVTADTGYKFNKWDKEDSLVIEATDIVVTAKATKLDNVIPEKTGETPNEKPKGYKTVTFVVKTGDEAKGSLEGVTKYYVNPTEYAKITPPEAKPNTGYVFGSWDKDPTIPTVYKEDTTITGSFNELGAVIPKTNPDGTENKQPAGYVTVTYEIEGKGGKIKDGEVTVYFVNPEKSVMVPQPKTSADTGYEFEKWDQNTATTVKKYRTDTTVKGNFKKLEDIIPSTDGTGKPNAKPDGYATVIFQKGDHGELLGQTVYYVNPKAKKTVGDLTEPKVIPNDGYRFKQWLTGKKTPINEGNLIYVAASYEQIDDVIPKIKDDGTENKKPEGYITVTFSTETNGKIKGTNKTEKVVYVNPNKAVVLKGHDPEVTPNTGFDFAGWDTQIGKKIQYSEGDKIKALYNEKGDVIPQEKTDGSDKPAGYLTVTFDRGEHGTLDGKTVYYVKPNKEVTVPAPTVTPATGYEFGKWDKELTQTFTEDTKITAQYKERDNIIPQKNTDGSDKPDGYFTVTFKSDANGSLSGNTVYYVKPNTDVDLTNTAEAITKNPNVGYTAKGGTWTPEIASKQYTANETYTFAFKPLADVIEKTGEDTKKPDDYVTVKLIPTEKATNETKAEKIYFVNPTKEVTITNKPVGKKEKVGEIEYTYNFNGWKATIGTIASWNDENIKGTFIQNTEITAQYTTKVEPGALIPAPVPKKNVVTPKDDVPKPEDLIGNPYDPKDPTNKDNLPDGTTFKYTNDGTPDVTKPGETTAKVEVKYPNGKTVVVEVPIKVVDHVLPQTGKDKPNVPANYVKVTFVIDPAGGGTIADGQTTIYYVNPKQDVTIDPPQTKAETGYSFASWNPNTKEAKKYESDTTVKGSFTKGNDIIPATNEEGKSNDKPEGYVTVTFDKGEHGKEITGETTYYVNPKADPAKTLGEITKPTVTPDTGFTANGWDTEDTTEIKSDITVTARYNPIDDVIPKTKDDESEKPDGYVTVTFNTTDVGGNVTKVVFVNPKKAVVLSGFEPKGFEVKKGYEFARWDISIDQAIQYKDGTVITALYNNPDDISTKEIDGYVKVEFKPGEHGSLSGPTTYWVKPGAEVYLPSPTVKANDGYRFDKWDKSLSVKFEANAPTYVITAQYEKQKPVDPTPDLRPYPVPGDCNNRCDQPNQPNQPNVGKDALNTTDHYQYLIGYPDGNFAPNKGMTRAEAATMFTRLLRERPIKWRHYNAGLNDIRPGDWYADTVGYAVQRGIVSGYPDGSFKPNKPITRAEFAAIASRFDALAQGNAISFSDLAPSHWGYNAIRSAATKGWISGYPDNTFRPEQAITRAEVTAITNRMLNRHADLYWIDAHPRDVIRFGDVKRSDWYFEPIMEATMGHDFIRDRDKKTEHWTGINGKSFI